MLATIDKEYILNLDADFIGWPKGTENIYVIREKLWWCRYVPWNWYDSVPALVGNWWVEVYSWTNLSLSSVENFPVCEEILLVINGTTREIAKIVQGIINKMSEEKINGARIANQLLNILQKN